MTTTEEQKEHDTYEFRALVLRMLARLITATARVHTQEDWQLTSIAQTLATQYDEGPPK